MPLKLREIEIQRTVSDLLEIDGWRLFYPEQNFSERKCKVVGEAGCPDLLAIRYDEDAYRRTGQPTERAEVLWCEFKRPGGVVSAKQKAWHESERARGALTIILGVDCEASIEGWMAWYHASGLNRGKV